MLIRNIRRPSLKHGISRLGALADEAWQQVHSADLNTLRHVRRHPRASAALALLTGLTCGVVVGAIVQHRLQDR